MADDQPPEHRAWVEAMPEGAAAALTLGQLRAWPPAALWRRLTKLDRDLSGAAMHAADALADRLYPVATSEGGRPPSIVQLALDESVTRDTIHAGLDELEERGYIEREKRKGQASHVRLTVPSDLYRIDGVIEESGSRTEGRVRRLPVDSVDTSTEELAAAVEEAVEAVPADPLDRYLSTQSAPQQESSNAKSGPSTGEELMGVPEVRQTESNVFENLRRWKAREGNRP